MKKVLCVLATVALVAVFATSCNKNCTCETYVNGKVVATTTSENPDKNKKCSDYTNAVTLENVTNGVVCK
ncbi:MAG: hypothetical protein MJZ76_06950 [Bacteroidales bacterium]|nr:hypothetical protein [Bacteroidales bacterium]